jgi:hypothetical protein
MRLPIEEVAAPEDRRAIPGFPGYVVTRAGEVWGCRNSRAALTDRWARLSPRPDRDGYLSVVLQRAGDRRTVKIAHLVLEAFVGPRPAGAVSRHHPNPDPTDNRATNLLWGTQAENIADKVALGNVARGERHGMSKLTEGDVLEIRRLRLLGMKLKQIGDRFGVSESHVSLICRGGNWTNVSTNSTEAA